MRKPKTMKSLSRQAKRLLKLRLSRMIGGKERMCTGKWDCSQVRVKIKTRISQAC